MTEHERIEELRRRVQQDQSSIAFAQLAEALRRAGQVQEAIDICRAGLAFHPDYLSAHVTLGRALIEAGDSDAAQVELTRVLAAASENLAAMKGLAEIHQQRGELREALDLYRRALELAPHDPDLELAVSQLETDLHPSNRTLDAGTGGSQGTAVLEPVAVKADLSAEPAWPPMASVEASPATPGDAPEEVHQPAPVASLQAEALERWLDAILADRERQS